MGKENDLDKFLQFVDEKIPDLKCELCGSDDWGVNEEQENYTFYIPTFQMRPQPDGPPKRVNIKIASPNILMFCRNCGNTKIMNRGVFETWLESHND